MRKVVIVSALLIALAITSGIMVGFVAIEQRVKEGVVVKTGYSHLVGTRWFIVQFEDGTELTFSRSFVVQLGKRVRIYYRYVYDACDLDRIEYVD